MGTAQRDVSRKKKTTRGWGRGESEKPPFPLSLFSSLFFSRSLPTHRTPLSERQEQATIIYNYRSCQSSGSSRIFLKRLSGAIGTIKWKPGVITAVCNVPLQGYAYAYSWNLEHMYRIFSIGINISHYISVSVLGFPLSFNRLSRVK